MPWEDDIDEVVKSLPKGIQHRYIILDKDRFT
jgi:hypothetical protein